MRFLSLIGSIFKLPDQYIYELDHERGRWFYRRQGFSENHYTCKDEFRFFYRHDVWIPVHNCVLAARFNEWRQSRVETASVLDYETFLFDYETVELLPKLSIQTRRKVENIVSGYSKDKAEFDAKVGQVLDNQRYALENMARKLSNESFMTCVPSPGMTDIMRSHLVINSNFYTHFEARFAEHATAMAMLSTNSSPGEAAIVRQYLEVFQDENSWDKYASACVDEAGANFAFLIEALSSYFTYEVAKAEVAKQLKVSLFCFAVFVLVGIWKSWHSGIDFGFWFTRRLGFMALAFTINIGPTVPELYRSRVPSLLNPRTWSHKGFLLEHARQILQFSRSSHDLEPRNTYSIWKSGTFGHCADEILNLTAVTKEDLQIWCNRFYYSLTDEQRDRVVQDMTDLQELEQEFIDKLALCAVPISEHLISQVKWMSDFESQPQLSSDINEFEPSSENDLHWMLLLNYQEDLDYLIESLQSKFEFLPEESLLGMPLRATLQQHYKTEYSRHEKIVEDFYSSVDYLRSCLQICHEWTIILCGISHAVTALLMLIAMSLVLLSVGKSIESDGYSEAAFLCGKLGTLGLWIFIPIHILIRCVRAFVKTGFRDDEDYAEYLLARVL